MIDIAQLIVFVPAALALNLTPGNDMMFCLGRGLQSGPKAGIAASLGIATGSLLHILMAAFGLAALLAAQPVAFEVLRWAGVCYLVWLGIQAVIRPAINEASSQTQPGTVKAAWQGGVVVNLLNPKVALFILAFVPQFVDPSRGSPVVQFLLLGAILNVGGTVINGFVGAFSGGLGAALTTNKAMARVFSWFSGLVFFSLAAKLAFENSR